MERAATWVRKGEPSTALVYAMHVIYHAVGARSPHWSQPPYEQMARDSLARRGENKAVVVDQEAKYFGTVLEERSLVT